MVCYPYMPHLTDDQIPKTEEEWKKILTPEQYHVLREKGTERAFTGELDHEFNQGMYECGACGQALFSSGGKYDSGCGWPAFFEALDPNAVHFTDDSSFGMTRIEVTCNRCGSHLGHVFNDGPADKGGQRFCINSASLAFKAE